MPSAPSTRLLALITPPPPSGGGGVVFGWRFGWSRRCLLMPQNSSKYLHLNSGLPRNPSDPSSGSNWKCGLGVIPSRVRIPLSPPLTLDGSPLTVDEDLYFIFSAGTTGVRPANPVGRNQFLRSAGTKGVLRRAQGLVTSSTSRGVARGRRTPNLPPAR